MMFSFLKTVFRSMDIVPVSLENASSLTYSPVKRWSCLQSVT